VKDNFVEHILDGVHTVADLKSALGDFQDTDRLSFSIVSGDGSSMTMHLSVRQPPGCAENNIVSISMSHPSLESLPTAAILTQDYLVKRMTQVETTLTKKVEDLEARVGALEIRPCSTCGNRGEHALWCLKSGHLKTK